MASIQPFWDSPSSSPSSSSLNLDLAGIALVDLMEHIQVRRRELITLPPEEQESVLQEIETIQRYIRRQNSLSQIQRQPYQAQQQRAQSGYRNSLASTTTNRGFNHERPSTYTPHSMGSSSSGEDSMGYYGSGVESAGGNGGNRTGGNGIRGNIIGNGKKRHRELDSYDEDVFDFETKSLRYTPSPRTFASTPLSGSPARTVFPQHEMLFPGGYSSAPSYTQPVPSDEETDRNLQASYDGGISPPNLSTYNPFQQIEEGSLHLPAIVAASPFLHHLNACPPPDRVIEISSDDDSESAWLGNGDGRFTEDGDFQISMGLGPFTISPFGDWRRTVSDSEFSWIDMPVGHTAVPNSFDVPRSTMVREQGVHTSSQQIVDSIGNVILNGGWEVPGGVGRLSSEVRSYADYVANDPTKTLDEIKALLETIRPDMEIPKEQREGTPEAMYYPLMEHQKVGLSWLKKMEESKTKGGILADDMGLGKTIQTLALLVSRPSENQQRKTTLIVAPVALLKQWEREIKKKLKPTHQLSVFIYHGGGKKVKSFADLQSHDVVLTTFGTIASEYKRKEQYDRQTEAGVAAAKPTLMLLGEESKFYRVVIDEAQWIKNRDTQSSRGCWNIDAQYRLCLSGTPMQNSCDELFSLLRFLRIKPYNEWSTFAQTFSRPLKKSNYSANQAMSKLQALLKAILLRRTKASEIDGKPILTLPPKQVTMVHAIFSPDEQAFYDALETKSKIQFNKYVKQNAVGRNYSNLLVLLLRLRQACCHPHLINDIEEAKDVNGQDARLMVELVHELSPDAVERIKESESLECPVCLDVSRNPSIVIPCGHLFCKECILQLQTQHEQSNLVRGEENSKLTCPGCRGELNPKRITDLNTFKTIYPPNDAGEVDDDLPEFQHDDDLIYDSDSDASDDEQGEDTNEYGDGKGFVVPDGASDDYVPGAGGGGKNVKSKPNPKSGPKSGPKSKLPQDQASKEKGKQKAKKGRTLAEVRKDAMRNENSKRLYHKYLERRWMDSAKISKCIEIIDDIQQEAGEKTIVFSQFTSLLDLLEVPISRKGIQYRRYDGGMSSNKRNQSLNDFQDDGNVKVLLVSLKAGNSGLNLVAASQVIIFDPFYNPYIELQAIDRAHRIGQQRRVIVHRLVVAGTVEDRVLELQEKKKKLIEGALDENAQRGLGRLTARDLGFLFGIGKSA